MKKFPVLFLVLAFTAGFISAQDIGLSAGLEFGILGANKPNDAEDVDPYLDVIVGYENSFLDEALDVSASLLYDIGFTKVPDPDNIGDEVNPNMMTLDLSVAYHLGLGDASTLSFILANQNDFTLVPKADDAVLGILKPGLKFNQGLGDTGDFYGQLDFPIMYANYGDKDTYSGLDITLGWASTFGLGFEAAGHILFSPDHKIDSDQTANGFTGISFTASYESGSISADIVLTVPLKKVDLGPFGELSYPYSYFDTLAGYGVAITPSFTYSFDFGLSAYLYIIIDGIGVKDNDVSISPAIGVTYSF